VSVERIARGFPLNNKEIKQVWELADGMQDLLGSTEFVKHLTVSSPGWETTMTCREVQACYKDYVFQRANTYTFDPSRLTVKELNTLKGLIKRSNLEPGSNVVSLWERPPQ